MLEGKAETSNLLWFEEFPSVSGEKGQEMLWKEQKGRLGFTAVFHLTLTLQFVS